MPCDPRQFVQPPFHLVSVEPVRHRAAAKHEEYSFPAILHGRKPGRLERNVGALDIALVLAVHVRHDRFQSREPGERQHFAQAVDLDDRLDGIEPHGAAPYRFGKASSVKIGVDWNVIAIAFRDGQQRIQLHMLDRAFRVGSSRAPPRDCLQHLFVGERRQTVRHLGMCLQDPEHVRILDDLEVVPQLLDRLVDFARPIRQRQDAHHLREPCVRGGADQQPTRLAALLVRVAAEPGPRTPAIPEREARQIRRLVHAPRLAALAPHDLLREVPARAAFIEPERPAARIVRAVDEPEPVDVIDVAPPARADEPRGDDRPPLEAPVIEGSARNQPPRAHVRSGGRAGILHHEPLGEAPRTDSPLLLCHPSGSGGGA